MLNISSSSAVGMAPRGIYFKHLLKEVRVFIVTTSGRSRMAGYKGKVNRGGCAVCGGRRGCGGDNDYNWKKKKYQSTTQEIKDNIADCRKTDHVAPYKYKTITLADIFVEQTGLNWCFCPSASKNERANNTDPKNARSADQRPQQ